MLIFQRKILDLRRWVWYIYHYLSDERFFFRAQIFEKTRVSYREANAHTVTWVNNIGGAEKVWLTTESKSR